MHTYMLVGTLVNDADIKWMHQIRKAPNVLSAINSYEVNGWRWEQGEVAAYRMDEAMLAKIPVAYGEPFGQQMRQLKLF